MRKIDLKHFEEEQEEFGTEVALKNFAWRIGSDIIKKYTGATRIKTHYGNDVGKIG